MSTGHRRLSRLASRRERGTFGLRFGIVVLALSLAGCATPKALERPAQKPEPAKAAAAPAVDPKLQQEYAQALAAMQAHKYAEAEPLLKALSGRAPEMSGPHANLGILYHRTGRYAQAVEALERAIELNPRPAYYNELGLAHRAEGRLDAARKAYERALELDPNYAYAHLNAGILYDLYLQEPEKALVHYQRYGALVPAEAGTVNKWIADLKRRTSQAAEQPRGGKSG